MAQSPQEAQPPTARNQSLQVNTASQVNTIRETDTNDQGHRSTITSGNDDHTGNKECRQVREAGSGDFGNEHEDRIAMPQMSNTDRQMNQLTEPTPDALDSSLVETDTHLQTRCLLTEASGVTNGSGLSCKHATYATPCRREP